MGAPRRMLVVLRRDRPVAGQGTQVRRYRKAPEPEAHAYNAYRVARLSCCGGMIGS